MSDNSGRVILPLRILGKVADCLTGKDRVAMALVCRSLYNHLVCNHCACLNCSDPSGPGCEWRQMRLEEINQHTAESLSPSPEDNSYWPEAWEYDEAYPGSENEPPASYQGLDLDEDDGLDIPSCVMN